MGSIMMSGDGDVTTGFASILGAKEIYPGDEVSYGICKQIFLYHVLGNKMAESPVKLAMSKPREITVRDLVVREVKQAFLAEWKRMKCDDVVRQLATVSRTYGLGAVILGCVGKKSNVPLTDEDVYNGSLFLNVMDPLNVAGSISIDQDPNSPMFQKWKGVAVGGKPYHRSRAVVLMNESPVYIAWTASAYSFSGRSVYQRALYPLQSFIRTMVTDDMVARKAGLLIAKTQPIGAIVDNVMAAAGAIKRMLLQTGSTNGVLQINAGNKTVDAEEIESLNLMNIDGAGGWARSNILKNIATASDMPAWFLENETLTSGFGEGEQDAENILRYIDGIREWLQPAYDFLDPLVMRRAWNPAFFDSMKAAYPPVFKGMNYNQAFYAWSNSFTAAWPNLVKEPDSKAVEREKVRLEALCTLIELLVPLLDPENLGTFMSWVEAAINDNKALFPKDLTLDTYGVVDQALEKAQQAITMMSAGNEDGDAEGAEPKPSPPRTMNIKDTAVLRDRLHEKITNIRQDRMPEGGAHGLPFRCLPFRGDAVFNESDHPRDNDGKFASGAGGGGSSSESKPYSPISHLKVAHLPTAKEVRNNFTSWADAEAKGREGRAQFADVLSRVAAKVGLSDEITSPDDLRTEHETNGKSYVFLGPNKGKERASAKVEKDYKGDWSQLKDMVRATIAVEHPDQMKEAIDQILDAGIEFASQPKDNVANPTEAHYRDINTMVRLPNGMLAELQFNVKSMIVAKTTAHRLYEQQAVIQRSNDGQPKDTWSPADREEYERLNEAQHAIYDPAWERSTSRRRPASTELQTRGFPPPSPPASEPRPHKERTSVP